MGNPVRVVEAVSLGILVADVIARPVSSYPPRGELVLVESVRPYLGGCAANTGVGLQSLGIETRVVGRVGRDGFGGFVRSELERHGVQFEVQEDPDAPTSATLVAVAPDGERSFLHSIGANATATFEDFEPALEAAIADGARLLHIAGHGLMPGFDGEGCAQLLQKARARGLLTSLDTAGTPSEMWCNNLRQVLPHLDYFVPSQSEAQCLLPGSDSPEALAKYLLGLGVGCVALKMGGSGSFVIDGRESHLVPAFSVRAVDATGAGDAFAAGFGCGVLKGYSRLRCATLGNACGALCATQIGTVAGYRSLPETLDFIKAHQAQRNT